MVSMLDVASHVISVTTINYRQMNVAGLQSGFLCANMRIMVCQSVL